MSRPKDASQFASDRDANLFFFNLLLKSAHFFNKKIRLVCKVILIIILTKWGITFNKATIDQKL